MQRLKRYQAATREDAYIRIREECGSDVEIVSTRNVRMPGLFGAPEREYVEVVVRVSDEELERRRKLAARLAAARAEAATQRANEALRARTMREPLDDTSHDDAYDAGYADNAGYADDAYADDYADEYDDAVTAPATLPAAEFAAAIAGETPSREDDPGLAPEFVNEFAGSGILPGGLMHPGLIGAAAGGVEDDRAVADAGPFGALNAAARAGSPLPAHESPAFAPDATAAASVGADEFRALVQQVSEMKTMLRELALERLHGSSADAPSGLAAARARLLERGVSAALAVPVLDQTAQGLPRNADEPSVLRTVERKLAAQLPAVPRVDFGRRPVVIFLVGPSGAGKTTLAVRLALDVQAHALSVTVAGTDVGRAGAPQQMTALGAATGVPVQLCYSPGELQSLVNAGGSDVVIVDTPGHTGARRDRMTELEAFMQATRRRHTLLVLPATMQGSDLTAVAKAFQPLGLEGLVITRCDETSGFGAVASAAVEAGLGIAYTTHGDGVNVAPRGGDNLMLARAVMSGQWPEAASLAAARGARAARTTARAGVRAG